ncbi:hypothetical protein ABPG77_001100 [Micractinium sp. CCAP 211/92]
MKPPRRRSVLRSRLLVLAAAGLLAWALFRRSGSSSSSGGDDGMAGVGGGSGRPCPLTFHRPSLEELRQGATPYLLGGRQQPACTNCRRSGEWAEICQFKAGPLCSEGVQAAIKWGWLQRGHELALRLTPCDLWAHLRGRTLWLLGDSMMLDFYKAAQCFLYEFWPSLQQRNTSTDAALQDEASRLLRSTCVDLLEGTRICYVRGDRGDDIVQRLLPLLPRLGAGPSDLLALNFGLHHGKPDDYAATLAAFTAYVGQHHDQLPRVLWQQTSQQHFKTAEGSGEYPGGGPPFECGPIVNLSVVRDGAIELEPGTADTFGLLAGGWRNQAADSAMAAAGIPIIHSFNETLWMADMHRWNKDGLECTHFCHPSAPQTWVLALFRALQQLQPLAAQGPADGRLLSAREAPF